MERQVSPTSLCWAKPVLPSRYLSAISPLLQHQHFLQVMTLNFYLHPCYLFSAPDCMSPKGPNLDSTPSTQNQSMSQKEECRCDKLRDGLLIQLPRKLLSLEAFHISGAPVLSTHKSSGHTGHHYYCCCYFHQ